MLSNYVRGTINRKIGGIFYDHLRIRKPSAIYAIFLYSTGTNVIIILIIELGLFASNNMNAA